MAEDKNIYTEVFPFAGNNDTLDKLDKYIKETIKCDHDGGGSSGSSDDPLIVNFTIQADQGSTSGFSTISDVVSTDAARAFYAGRRVIGLCNLHDAFNLSETLVLTPNMISNENTIDGDNDNLSFFTMSVLPTGGRGIIELYASYAENELMPMDIIPIPTSTQDGPLPYN
jgi:hypothetical protein